MVDKIVHELRQGHRRYFGSASTPEAAIVECIEYPNSKIARVRFQWPGETLMIFLKILHPELVDGRANRSDRQFKEEQILAEFTTLERLDAAFEPHPELGVVTPIGCFPEHIALATKEKPGSMFSTQVGRVRVYSRQASVDELADWFRLCGRWLRCFQTFEDETAGAATFDFAEVSDYCDVRLEILADHRPQEFTSRFCGAIRAFLQEQVLAQDPDSLEIVGRHNDYGPYNMILSGRQLVVLDFAGFNFGPSLSDYVKLWCTIDSMRGSPLVSTRMIATYRDAFASGYGRAVDTANPLFLMLRLAYVLDKMGDICLDWDGIPMSRRLTYRMLYRRYLSWIANLTRPRIRSAGKGARQAR